MQSLLLAQVQWAQVGIVIGIFAAIAVLLTVCILLVAKFCKSNANEKVESILSHLAGANCGGCGCTGCAGFAEKLAKGEASLSDCHVTESGQKAAIAEILGVPFSAGKPTVSVCHCSGGSNAADAFIYNGAQDCSEEIKLAGGHKICTFGCLGGGNCARICPENAISFPEACAQADDRCVSCGACILNCPKNLFSRIPADAKVYIACASHDKGKAVMDACKTGCIGCGKCAKICPQGAITMQNNLPVINYDKCTNCGNCAAACPRGSIRSRY